MNNLKLENRWRRPLSPVEEAEMRASFPAGSPELADWELDLALTRTLSDLPDAPVSSNFTARVLGELDRNTAAERVELSARWPWRRLLPRTAVALSGVLSLAAILSLLSHHQQAQARQLAQSLATVSNVSSLPGPDVLQDFEAIRRLNASPAPDEQLLALFP
jgi:hypothetical protein